MATAVLGWPIGKLPHSMAQKVMQGAKEICTQAGIPLAGGHSIESVEPFFGLSVNGIVHPVQIKRNNTLQEGDRLYLTKPLGTGVLSSGLKRGLIAQEQMADAIDSMCTLNTIGARLAPCKQVHAITDVTGFGLAGHLGEMTASSNLSVQLDFRAIPIFSAAQSLIDQMVYPDITTKNYSHIFPKIGNLGMQEMIVLCDPQTSGGLLISVASTFVETFEKMLVEEGISSPCLVPIGTVVSKQEKEIVIVS